MTDKTPLSTPAALVMGAVALSPVIGAGFSLTLRSWGPVGLGLVLAAGLFIAFCVGEAIAAARRARTQPLRPRCWSCGMEQGDRAENSESTLFHQARFQILEEMAAEQARWRAAPTGPCPLCSDPDGPGVVRLGSESGKREPDSNPITRPGPPESGRRGA